MGRKVHPIGFRLGITRTWDARWYAEGDKYVDQIHEDIAIRELIRNEAARAGVSRIEIERFPGKVNVIVARQIESRISFSRAMSRTIQRSMRQGAKGIRIEAAGRLGGAEMARTIHMREGPVPRQTLRADIDYALQEAATAYGNIGIKVWIYKGEVLPAVDEEEDVDHDGVYVSR